MIFTLLFMDCFMYFIWVMLPTSWFLALCRCHLCVGGVFHSNQVQHAVVYFFFVLWPVGCTFISIATIFYSLSFAYTIIALVSHLCGLSGTPVNPFPKCHRNWLTYIWVSWGLYKTEWHYCTTTSWLCDWIHEWLHDYMTHFLNHSLPKLLNDYIFAWRHFYVTKWIHGIHWRTPSSYLRTLID